MVHSNACKEGTTTQSTAMHFPAHAQLSLNITQVKPHLLGRNAHFRGCAYDDAAIYFDHLMGFVLGSSSTGGGSLQNRYCGGFLTDGQVSLSVL